METLFELDRQVLYFFNGSDSLFWDSVISTLTSGLTWIPFYLCLIYLVIKNKESVFQILLTLGFAALCVIVTAGLTDLLVKPWVGRLRPCMDPSIKYFIDTVYGFTSKDFSFWSAHAANTSSLAVFVSFLIREKKLIITMVLWCLFNCYTRLYLGMHYPSDILCGLLVGALLGCVTYYIYQKIYYRFTPKINYISSHFTSTGFAISDIDVAITVMVFTLLYAIIRAVVVCL